MYHSNGWCSNRRYYHRSWFAVGMPMSVAVGDSKISEGEVDQMRHTETASVWCVVQVPWGNKACLSTITCSWHMNRMSVVVSSRSLLLLCKAERLVPYSTLSKNWAETVVDGRSSSQLLFAGDGAGRYQLTFDIWHLTFLDAQVVCTTDGIPAWGLKCLDYSYCYHVTSGRQVRTDPRGYYRAFVDRRP